MDEDARGLILDLLATRAPGKTLCPSEVARAFVIASSEPSADDWRAAMPIVHRAVDRLLGEGLVRLTWKGKVMPERSGPYRIGRGIQDER